MPSFSQKAFTFIAFEQEKARREKLPETKQRDWISALPILGPHQRRRFYETKTKQFHLFFSPLSFQTEICPAFFLFSLVYSTFSIFIFIALFRSSFLLSLLYLFYILMPLMVLFDFASFYVYFILFFIIIHCPLTHPSHSHNYIYTHILL